MKSEVCEVSRTSELFPVFVASGKDSTNEAVTDEDPSSGSVVTGFIPGSSFTSREGGVGTGGEGKTVNVASHSWSVVEEGSMVFGSLSSVGSLGSSPGSATRVEELVSDMRRGKGRERNKGWKISEPLASSS